MVTQLHPWSRYVAIGDSFTEGIGDPEPRSPGGHRGWADRVAEVLSAQTEGFAYANLAVRLTQERGPRDPGAATSHWESHSWEFSDGSSSASWPAQSRS